MKETIHQTPTGCNLSVEELVAFYNKAQATNKERASTTVKDLMVNFLEHTKQAGRSKAYLTTLKCQLNHSLDYLPKMMSEVKLSHIESCLHSLPNLKTRKNARITLITFFKFAKKQGLYSAYEETPAERTICPKVIPIEPDIFTPEEISRMLTSEHTNKKQQAFLILGGFCGIRSAEIHRLTWESVKQDYILISPSISKTARRRLVEIPPNAIEWLDKIREKSGPVTYMTLQSLYFSLQDLCRKLKIEWKKNGLRHSFASYHLELHRDAPRTSKTAGHSLAVLETVYSKLVCHAEAEKWFSITPKNHLA